MSASMPHVKWYGRDWLGDPLLRMVGPAERGVWIDLLSAMMLAEPFGHLAVKGRPMTDLEASRLIGVDETTYKGILYRLEEAGIPSRTEEGVLYSRRLVRDYKRFMCGKISGKKGGGNPALSSPTPPSDPEETQNTRSQKPEAREGIKVTYIGPDIDEGVQGEWEPSQAMIELGSWFRRKPTTRWSAKEVKAFKAICDHDGFPPEIHVVRAWYTAKINEKDADFRRRDLLTLLNNWTGEIDRAKQFITTRRYTEPTFAREVTI